VTEGDLVIQDAQAGGQVPLAMRQFEIPAAAPGEALVRLYLAGVCGSDLHTFNLGKWGLMTGVVIPGHEMMGEVVSVGEGAVDANGKPLYVGERVVPESTLPCLRCATCRGFGSRYDKVVDYTACENY
jgi:threonine dehydrogenase-like Zn-dependent dehydrogenase